MKYIDRKEVYILEEPVGYQEISETNFRLIIQQEGKPAVVTFTGDWMGSATMLHLLMEDLWSEYKDKMYFFCVNLEKSTLAKEFGIMNTATVCFFNKGEIVDQQVGLVSKSKLRSKIEQFLHSLSA